MEYLAHLTYHLTAACDRGHGDSSAGLAALRESLASLPDAGAAACRVMAALACSGPGDRLELTDGDGTRPATAAERAAWRQWCAAEEAAYDAEYAGWATRPQSGGTCYAARLSERPRRGLAGIIAGGPDQTLADSIDRVVSDRTQSRQPPPAGRSARQSLVVLGDRRHASRAGCTPRSAATSARTTRAGGDRTTLADRGERTADA